MINSSEPERYVQTGLWQETVNLLKGIQVDYQGVRRQLDQLNLHIASKEAIVNQQFQRALSASKGHNTLCLIKYAVDSSVCQLGSVVMGGISHLRENPESLTWRCAALDVLKHVHLISR